MLFTTTLSGKHLGCKTRPGVNVKTPRIKSNNSIECLLLVELLEDYTECTSHSTTKLSLHHWWCDSSKSL